MLQKRSISSLFCIVLLIFFSTLLSCPFFSSVDETPYINGGLMTSKALLTNVATIPQTTIVFDIAGVLFHPSKKSLLFEIGLFSLFRYAITHFKNPVYLFETVLLKLLYEIDGTSDKHFYKEYPLPEIICKWQRGEIACEQILKQVEEKINDWDQKKLFSSVLEKEIIQKIVRIIFNPELLARQSFKRIESGIALLQAFAKKRADGLINSLYILSNFEKETLAVMQQLYPDVFNLFDGIVISGDLGVMKPDQGIFEKLIEKFNLNPAHCLFIDDQEENVKAAQAIGMTAVQFLR